MKSKNTILFLLLLTLGLAGCNEVSSELNSSPSIEDNSSSKESITPSVKPSEPSTIPSEPSDIHQNLHKSLSLKKHILQLMI